MYNNVVEKFRLELLQSVIDRVNHGCSRNTAFMHAASQAHGATKALKLIAWQEWPQYEVLGDVLGRCQAEILTRSTPGERPWFVVLGRTPFDAAVGCNDPV